MNKQPFHWGAIPVVLGVFIFIAFIVGRWHVNGIADYVAEERPAAVQRCEVSELVASTEREQLEHLQRLLESQNAEAIYAYFAHSNTLAQKALAVAEETRALNLERVDIHVGTQDVESDLAFSELVAIIQQQDPDELAKYLVHILNLSHESAERAAAIDERIGYLETRLSALELKQ